MTLEDIKRHRKLYGYGRYNDTLDLLIAEVERLTAINEKLKTEASLWKMEARCQQSTVAECYRAAGSKAGDWHGASPVREAFDNLNNQNKIYG